MAAVRALLEPVAPRSTQRRSDRRKLSLQAQGSVASGSTEVFIRDISTTGLLLETAGELVKGETIEFDIPEAVGVRAVVKWSSGQLFGCQFKQPISTAAVSAALLRAPNQRPGSAEVAAQAEAAPFENDSVDQSVDEVGLTFALKMRWILGLTFLSWAVIIGTGALAWWALG